MIRDSALNILEQTLNGYLRLDPETPAKLAPLAGKVIAIEITSIGQLYLLPQADRLRLQIDHTGSTDVTLRGTLLGFFKLATLKQTNPALFTDEITIQGNTDVAEQLHQLHKEFDIDWEEILSHCFGDILAHQIGNTMRKLASFGHRRMQTLQYNLTEYLQEEIRFFPPREELEDFFAAIEQLRDDNERLSIRIKRMELSLVQNLNRDTHS